VPTLGLGDWGIGGFESFDERGLMIDEDVDRRLMKSQTRVDD